MRTEIYIGLLVLSFFTAGCQDWLNVQPKTSVQEEDIFSTEYGFKDVLTGFYIDMGSQDLYGKNLTYGFVDFLAKRYDAGPIIVPVMGVHVRHDRGLDGDQA